MKDIANREFKHFPKPVVLKEHGNARIISVCSQKGGVGKTTSVIALAAALGELGRKVLVVDFDPQGAASAGLGVNAYALETTVYDLMLDDSINVKESIIQTDTPNLWILPTNIDLSMAEIQLVNEVARESILKNILEKVRNDFDCILIDCQPSLGLLTVNALTAADGVIIPFATEYFAMRGVGLLIDTIEKVQKKLNPKLSFDGIFATMYDARTIHSAEVVDSILEGFGDKLLHTAISRTVKFPDSTAAAESIITFAPKHQGAEQYRSLANELIFRKVIK